eukprot:GHVQ01012267.1.p1 GENE.GHVQ01012267.1~~GHVQ01012267.1.p1  ORF type:complete len:461 (+),score=58.35 GHVQ01012267.1:297-1679(+)
MLLFSDQNTTTPTAVEGGWTTNQILHVVKNSLSLDHVVYSLEDLESMLDHSRLSVVGLFTAKEQHRTFAAISRKHPDMLFVETNNTEVHADFLQTRSLSNIVKQAPAVVILKPWDEKTVAYDGDTTDLEGLQLFIKHNSLPYYHPFGTQSGSALFPDGRPIAFFFRPQEFPIEQLNAQEEIVAEMARTHRGRIIFSSLTNTEAYERRLLEIFGLDEETSDPILSVFQHHNSDEVTSMEGVMAELRNHKYHKYLLTEQLTMDSVRDFLQKFLDGGLKPSFRSEPIPQYPTELAGKVASIVSNNFKEFISEEHKDKFIFVEFFAPWCGHCRKMEPILKEVAKRLVNVKNVVIAKFDSTRNELSNFSIDGYPTFILFHGQATQDDGVAQYQGERTVERIIKWIHKYSAHAFDMSLVKKKRKRDSTGKNDGKQDTLADSQEDEELIGLLEHGKDDDGDGDSGEL